MIDRRTLSATFVGAAATTLLRGIRKPWAAQGGALAAPLAYTSSVENINVAEEDVNRQITDTLLSIVDTVHKDTGHAQRGVHAKSHALLRGEFTVHDNLAPELAQGLFATPRTYDAVMRISSIAGDVLDDSVSLPRGFAMKIYGVEGDRLPGAEDSQTQDFLMASGTVFAVPDTKSFLQKLKLLAGTTDKLAWAKSALSAILRPIVRAEKSAGIKPGVLPGLSGYPETNPVSERYGTQIALRYGTYVAKLDLVPESANFIALKDKEFDLNGRPNAIRDEIIATLAQDGGAWTVRAQLRRDAQANPVEDPSVPWPEDSNPYLPVATLTVKPQTAWSPERSRLIDDEMAFSPWHGIAAHQPLGVVGRARKYIYPKIAAHRGALNGCPMHEGREPPNL